MKHLDLDQRCYFVAFTRLRFGLVVVMVGGGRGEWGPKTAQMEELSERSHFWLKALLTQSAQISSRNKPRTHLCWLIPVQCWLKIEASECWNAARLSFVEWLDFCWLRNPQHLSSENAQVHLFIHCCCLCLKYTPEEEHANLSWAQQQQQGLLQGPFALYSAPAPPVLLISIILSILVPSFSSWRVLLNDQ